MNSPAPISHAGFTIHPCSDESHSWVEVRNGDGAHLFSHLTVEKAQRTIDADRATLAAQCFTDSTLAEVGTQPAPLWQREFPDYPATSMPAIPQGFVDSSWRNNSAPCFIHEPSGVVLWVEFPEPAQRDYPESPRFIAQRCTTRDEQAGWQFDGGLLDLFESDDWATVERSLPNFTRPAIVARIAAAFVGNLRDQLTDSQWDQMRETNRHVEPGVCASHDVCDANMPMSDAFESVMGREIDCESDDDCRLWGDAWRAAMPDLTAPDDDDDSGDEPCPINRRPISTCPAGCDHGAGPAVRR